MCSVCGLSHKPFFGGAFLAHLVCKDEDASSKEPHMQPPVSEATKSSLFSPRISLKVCQTAFSAMTHYQKWPLTFLALLELIFISATSQN